MGEDEQLYIPSEEVLRLLRGEKAKAYSKEYSTYVYSIVVKDD